MTRDLILDPYLRNALLDLCMDGVLLWAAGAIAGRQARFRRLLAAAAAGGLYNLWLGLARDGFLPGWPLLGAPAVYFLLIPGIMLGLAFLPAKPGAFARTAGAFFFLAVLSWGMASAVLHFAALRGRSFSPFFCTLLEIGLVLAAGELGWGILVRAAVAGTCRVSVAFAVDGFRVETEGYLDTGNHLRDPFTRRPVAVVDYGLVQAALTPAARSLVEAIAEGNPPFPHAPEGDPWLARLRVIPYRSVERRLSLLPALRVDELRLRRRGVTVVHRAPVVGLERAGVLAGDGCRALVPPALWMEGGGWQPDGLMKASSWGRE